LGPRSGPFACPAYNRLRGAFTPLGGEEWAFGLGAYGYNGSGLGLEPGNDIGNRVNLPTLGLGGNGDSDSFGPARENQVVSPSDMIAMGDAFFDNDPLGGHLYLEFVFIKPFYYDLTVRGLPPGNPATQAMRQRHGGRWNTGFADGHVENLRDKGLFDLTNPDVARRWNNDHKPHNQLWQPPP
jgi:prepilin-type processing-associated H-X9-DG protein